MTIVDTMISQSRTAWSALRELAQSRTFQLLAEMLGAAVLVLIGLHLAQLLTGDRMGALGAFALDRDRGLAECFEYAMSFAAAACLLLCLKATRQAVYASLAGLHLWLMLDNALQLHERLGARLEAFLLSLGGPPVGESGVFMITMLTIALVVSLSLWRASGFHRALGLGLIAAATPIAAFAAGVDLVHGRLATLSPLIDQALILLEDGGELTLFALNAAFAAAAWAQLRRRRFQAAFSLGGPARTRSGAGSLNLDSA